VNAPTENGFFWPAGDDITITYDLGTAIAPDLRQLDAFSIWVANNDSQRNGFNGSLSVSLDGITFTSIADTAFAINPAFNAGNSGTFNQILYTFSPGDVVDFRYLRLTTNNQSSGNQPRLIELDAFVTVIPEPGTIAALLCGMIVLTASANRRFLRS